MNPLPAQPDRHSARETPRASPTLVASGLATTLLLLALPMLHLGLRPTTGMLALATLPVVALAVAVRFPAIPALTHFVFPVSHLPLLIAHPKLTSTEVYGGASGLFGLLAILVSGAVFLASTAPPIPRPTRTAEDAPQRPWPRSLGTLRLLALAFALLPALALTLATISSPDLAPENAALALLLGPLLAVGTVGLWLTRALTPGDRDEALASLARRSRPSASRTTWVIIVAALAIGLTVFWSHWRP